MSLILSTTEFCGTQANDNNPSAKTMSFRRSDLIKILRGRYNGPCLTENAERYLEAAIPMLMSMARSWRLAVKWAEDWTPELLERQGEEWVHERWLEIAKRKRRNLTSDQLSKLLRVTDEEPKLFELRCIPAMSNTKSVRKAKDRERRAKAEQERRAAKPGHRSREERRKDREEIRELLGIGDRQVRRLREKGLLNGMLAEARKARKVAQNPECPLSVPLVSGNDNVRISCPSDPLTSLQEQSGQKALETVVPAIAVVDDVASVLEVGFAGRTLVLDALAVQRLAERYPHFADEMGRHLAEIDAAMVKHRTGDGDKLRVLHRNLRNRHRSPARAVRQAA